MICSLGTNVSLAAMYLSLKLNWITGSLPCLENAEQNLGAGQMKRFMVHVVCHKFAVLRLF